MNTLDIDYKDPGMFCLFKGPSGSGKSVGALSFPNVWLADLDRKMPTIARKHFPNKSIDYDVFDDCFALADKVSDFVENGCPFETLVYDSLTSLSSLVIKSIAQAKGEELLKMLKRIQATKSGKAIPELLGIDYYNAETRFFEGLLDMNKVLWSRPGNPKNIIFIAHIITVDSAPDLKTRIVTRSRSIVTAGRKVAAYVPTQFDEVYLFGTAPGGGLDGADSRVRHIMTTETCGEDDAKTAFRLQQSFDFTDGNLYNMLQSQIAGSEMFT